MRYHDKKPNESPMDRKEEKKLLTVEHIEKGAHTSKQEKKALMGTKNGKVNKKK
jgi:hypothetical protein